MQTCDAKMLLICCTTCRRVICLHGHRLTLVVSYFVTMSFIYLYIPVPHSDTSYRAIAGRTARCRCKFRYVSKCTAASRGFSATARLSCI